MESSMKWISFQPARRKSAEEEEEGLFLMKKAIRSRCKSISFQSFITRGKLCQLKGKKRRNDLILPNLLS